MPSSFKQISFILSLTILVFVYFLINSNYYRMTQLDHLDDRIRFGRLEFHNKANLTVKNIQIHNRQKIFTINFHGENVFVGHMEHFLVLMEGKANVQSNGDGFYNIEDNIQKVCKIQKVLSLYPNYETNQILLRGSFTDCQNIDYQIIFSQTADNKLQIRVEAPQQYQRIYLLFNNQNVTDYYGLGQQFSYLNLGKDRPYSTLTRQKGFGRGQQPLTLLANILYGAGGSFYTSYAPTPIWFSSKKIAYALNSHHYMAWMDNKIQVWSNSFKITYIKGQSYKELVKQISQINGYTRPIPDWVNSGAVIGIQGGTQNVLQKYNILKNAGSKIAGVWIQDWVSKRQSMGYSRLWWNWQLDSQHYRNWDLFREQLKKDSVELLIYINPMLSDANQKANVKKNYYKIAQEMGYFVKLKNGQIFKTKLMSDFQASLIDFDNQEATKFFKYLIQHALKDTNAKGMMVDFSQAYPIDSIKANSTEHGMYLHNQFPTLYHQKISRIVNELLGNSTEIKPEQFYVFARAGHLNSPKYAHSLWAGDQAMSFDFHNGLPSCLTAILSSGLVGYSNTHCDIGGCIHISNQQLTFTKRTQILLIRWMQLSAFTSVFRSHQGNLPQATLQVYSNELLSKSFAFYSNLFFILSDYRKQQIQLSQRQRLPLLRPLFLQLNGIQGTQSIQDQFFLGSDIMVAPFLSQESERKFFLPKGEWKALWTSKIYKGCDCVRVCKEQILPPIFIRTSSNHCETTISKIQELISKYKDIIYKVPTSVEQQL